MREKAGNQFFSHGIHGRTRKKDERESVFCFSFRVFPWIPWQKISFNQYPPKPHHPTPNAQPTPPSQGFCTAPNHPPTAAARFHAPPAPPPARACAPWPCRSPCTH